MIKENELKEINKIIHKENGFFFLMTFFIFFITTLISLFFYYITFTELNIVAEAEGVVIPSSKVKTIQHLEGGIIKKIYVNPGDMVKKNEKLLELEPIKSLSNFSELEKRLTALSINITRLRAESEFKEIQFQKEIEIKNPKLIEDAMKLFKVRQNKYYSALKEQKNILKNEEDTLFLLEEQIQISKSLLEEQLTNRLKHLDLLKEKSMIVAKIDNAKSKIKSIKESYLTETRTLLLEEITEFEELNVRKKTLRDNLNRTLVKAPEEGIIKQRFIDTIGGVIKEGEPLFDIVPIKDKLIILSKLSVDQIGYIKKGQEVMVKLVGKNNSIYQPLEGKVINISPDAIYDKDTIKEPYFEVKVETLNNFFESDNEKYFMYPGTQVITLIRIGSRTIATYLLEPIFSKLSIALSEK